MYNRVKNLQKQFVDYYDPTIEEQYIQHCEIDGQCCKLDGYTLLIIE